ncbi:glutamine ABC transporter ATP-binding protein [Spirochaetia bacterium]|nr:glutamine ABC transporter ATP-binding protein [Spirochaetia bacterium]
MTSDKDGVLLEIENLNKSFDGTSVLKNVSLRIKRREVVVVLGPSGCGKSTLLRCLNGLEIIQSGRIILNGDVLAGDEYLKTDWRLVRQKIGMVFQSYELFPHLNVLENILLGPLRVQKRERKEAEAAAFALLKRIGLSGKTYAFPRQLSGGQKQRVAIIRALIMEPELMLFDEVTAALDPEMVREVLDVMLELAKSGMTMIIVTHEMQFAKAIADRVVFIDEGEIIEENAPEKFFADPATERARRFLNIFQFDGLGAGV